MRTISQTVPKKLIVSTRLAAPMKNALPLQLVTHMIFSRENKLSKMEWLRLRHKSNSLLKVQAVDNNQWWRPTHQRHHPHHLFYCNNRRSSLECPVFFQCLATSTHLMLKLKKVSSKFYYKTKFDDDRLKWEGKNGESLKKPQNSKLFFQCRSSHHHNFFHF